jgi:hypothetical protein
VTYHQNNFLVNNFFKKIKGQKPKTFLATDFNCPSEEIVTNNLDTRIKSLEITSFKTALRRGKINKAKTSLPQKKKQIKILNMKSEHIKKYVPLTLTYQTHQKNQYNDEVADKK